MKGKSEYWLRVVLFAAIACLMTSLWGCGSGGDTFTTDSLSSEVKSAGDGIDGTKGLRNADSPPFVAGELLVQFRAGVARDKLNEVLGALKATQLEEILPIRIKRIKVPAQALESILAALSRNPNVKFAEKNYLVKAESIPNDGYYSTQWHLPKISAPTAWDISTGTSSISIAIADTGVDPAHPDLAAKLLPGYNFVLGNSDTHDVYGHGTLVAGSAAAISNNSVGVAGVAWNNPIVPLVIADSSGYATYSSLANSITYAADHGIRIINLSFGGTMSSITLQNAIDYAWNKGTIVFASAGNSANSVPQYPAACNHVVAVTATTSTDSLASFSSYGSWVTVSAPGKSILTTSNGGGYAYASGTSFSAPITAGLGALILSVNPNLTATQVVDIIKQGVDDKWTVGFDQYFGYGRINAYKSLILAKNTMPQVDSTPPDVSITSPDNGAIVSGTVQVDVSATDNVGVSRVELYVNGTLLSTDTTAPYSFSWDTSTEASENCSLQAIAYDAAGNTGLSGTVAVTVSKAVADITPPDCSITSPANGAIVSGTVQVNVAATDNVGVSRVELYVNGTLLSADTTAPYSFSWNTNGARNGTNYLEAVAYDAAGNTSSSGQVAVTVSVSSDMIAPTVTINRPVNGTSITNLTAVTIAASASDNVKAYRMELYVDGVLKKSVVSRAISFLWYTTTVPSGTHTILARAYDLAGNMGSASIEVYK
jgi:hypothetical protein